MSGNLFLREKINYTVKLPVLSLATLTKTVVKPRQEGDTERNVDTNKSSIRTGAVCVFEEICMTVYSDLEVFGKQRINKRPLI